MVNTRIMALHNHKLPQLIIWLLEFYLTNMKLMP